MEHFPTSDFDVIVVGGGHAGCEAAAAAARLGARVALVTMSAATIGAMSCNPSIGGLGKGHLVREVDAFDGLMARAADHAGIHYRMLNASKGKAVQGPRVQADRPLYAKAVRMALDASGIRIVEGRVDRLLIERDSVGGVGLGDESELRARAVVLATGTFLNACMYRGDEVIAGGRVGEAAATHLARQLGDHALPLRRLKTGTPPRLEGRTIAWDRLRRQDSDVGRWTMSPMSRGRTAPQLFCAETRTNAATHEVIRDNEHRSPLFSGAISGSGPRYCPSIEDKVRRFADRDGHQVYLEPEGLASALVYPNGISTSLPTDVQQRFVNRIAGLERAVIVQPGYAVEYEHVDPRVLDGRLEVRNLAGLFLAGQINGTTGYEEAAAQGLVAGLNAGAAALGREPVRFSRETSYIGVMIDDLTLHGVTEPYRMLTARAEYRLRLRADNAETRLGDVAEAAGCLTDERKAHRERRGRERDAIGPELNRSWSPAELRAYDIKVGEGERRTLAEWTSHPVLFAQAEALLPEALRGAMAAELLEDARYAPYVARQDAEIAIRSKERAIALGSRIEYRDVAGLSAEMVEKLERSRPDDLDQASRIRGITPAALSAILVASRQAGSAKLQHLEHISINPNQLG